MTSPAPPASPASRVERAVLERIDESALVEFTRALLRAAGQNPPGGEASTAAVLSAAGIDLGLDVVTTRVEQGRDNVSIRRAGGSGPGLLLLGHTDVVPVGDGWTTDPFGAEVRERRIYGRGASDMKGGLAACLAALAALQEVELSGPVELAALVDEEETGKGIRSYVAAADADGTSYAGCVVAEPTDLQTIIGARGDSYLRITVTGRAAHAGNPADGANAVYGAAAVITEIQRLHEELAADPHPLIGPATWSVGQINGGTGTSIVPAGCVVMADRRLLPGESADAMVTGLRRRIEALGLADRGLAAEVELTMEMPGFATPADAPLVSVVERALADAGGPGLPLGGWTAACDGGFVARQLGVPVVVLGPGSVTNQAHRADESVGIDELVIAARTYALTAVRLLG